MNQSNKNIAQSERAQSNTKNETVEQVKTNMFYYDHLKKLWFIHPKYHKYFSQLLDFLKSLRRAFNPKWNREQEKSYITFIDQLSQLITQYIFSGQICFFEDYQAYIQYMKTTGNPVGVDLYEKQIEYLQKKFSGYDFGNDKNKNKNNDQNEVKIERPKKRNPIVEKKTIEILQEDPEINIQKLMSKEWDDKDNKYLSTSLIVKKNINIVLIGHVNSGKSTLTGNILKELNQVDEIELLRTKQNAQNRIEQQLRAISDAQNQIEQIIVHPAKTDANDDKNRMEQLLKMKQDSKNKIIQTIVNLTRTDMKDVKHKMEQLLRTKQDAKNQILQIIFHLAKTNTKDVKNQIKKLLRTISDAKNRIEQFLKIKQDAKNQIDYTMTHLAAKPDTHLAAKPDTKYDEVIIEKLSERILDAQNKIGQLLNIKLKAKNKIFQTIVYTAENGINNVESRIEQLLRKIQDNKSIIQNILIQIAKANVKDQNNNIKLWVQASISDIIPNESKNGNTIEFAKLNFSLKLKRFTLVDVPGYANYVPNMIMGASQADIAVLIISAKDKQFQQGFDEKGQTKEHALLAKALGVNQLIAVVTKMQTVNWSQNRFNHIKNQVSPFLQNQCGFHDVIFIPIESILNVNIHKPIENSWYRGPYFLKYLDNVQIPARKATGYLRIPIIDKFKDLGKLFIYGTIESGTIIENQAVTILPGKLQLVIKQIFNAKDERLPFACAGESVKLYVQNIDEKDVSRGFMLCNNLNYCQISSQFKAIVNIFELPYQRKLLSSGYECVMHMHAIANQVKIQRVYATIDKVTNKKKAATFLKNGQTGICSIKIEKPICLQKFENMPNLGRFILRDGGKTIGYGQIVGIKPVKELMKERIYE